MKLSARNVLSATVKAVTPGAVDTRDPEGEIGRTGTRVSYMDAPLCQAILSVLVHRNRLLPYIRPVCATRSRGP
jgi:hypothetical protein